MTLQGRLLTAACLAFTSCLLISSAASGHAGGQFYGRKWPMVGGSANVVFHFAAEPELGDQRRDSIRFGYNRWDNAGGASFTFGFNSNDTSNYVALDRLDCAPDPLNDVHWENLNPIGDNVVGVANACDDDGDGDLDSHVAIFDATRDWNSGSGGPASNETDLRSVAAYESGHVTGFGVGAEPDHFDDVDPGLCPINSTHETMCSFTVLGTTWGRTLEAHDKHTIDNAY